MYVNSISIQSHGAVQDSNRFVTSSPAPAAELAPPASKPPPPPPASSSSLPATNLRSSQQFLQARIQQLQAENAALRKQRMLASGHLSWSASNLAQLNPKRPVSIIKSLPLSFFLSFFLLTSLRLEISFVTQNLWIYFTCILVFSFSF